MEMKVCLVAAAFFMLLGHVTAQGGSKIVPAPDPAKVIAGTQILLTCKLDNDGAVPNSGVDVVWKKDATPVTGGSGGNTIGGTKGSTLTINPSATTHSGAYTCTVATKTESTPATTVLVEDPMAPTITCNPTPKVGVQTTCDCQKAATQTIAPTNCKLKVGTAGTDGTAAACNALTYTPVAADKGKKIFCKAVFGATVSPVSAAGVDIVAPQAKPTIDGAKTDADDEVTLTCKAEKADESGIKYKWYKAGTVVTGQEASTTKVKCDGGKEFKYTCKVTNAGGDSDASDEATVKFKATCKSTNGNAAAGIRPSLMILGFILLLTTILLKQ